MVQYEVINKTEGAMNMFEKKLQQYVNLIIKKGLNIQKGDNIFITADVKCQDFVQQVTNAAYLAGARLVHADYSDEVVERYKGLYATDEIFDIFPEYRKTLIDEQVKISSKRLVIASPNPQGMAGVDSSKLMRLQKAAYEPMQTYRALQLGNHMNWCIAAVPNPIWANIVFPDVEDNDAAVELLWEVILKCTHVEDGPDACANWDNHVKSLHNNVKMMNDANFKTLHYTNSLGTDLYVGLPKGHVWSGGGDVNVDTKESFAPNIPTEEVFTAPDANNINGIVYSSMPLLYQGQTIENFYFKFVDGVVVEAFAEKGNEMLQAILDSDAGARRLGEVALVPFTSPISQSGLIFNMTLFDENAACHFALGEAYDNTLPASIGKTPEEQLAIGFNTSMVHVDFMMGTADLSIVGITATGEKIPVFIDGCFA